MALVLGAAWAARAQPGSRPAYPSAPWERRVVDAGLPVSPFFEGWYENPDGSYTLSFGYFNRNREETVVVPPGPDNFLTPAVHDGRQPTVFSPGRATGVFTVTVPGDVVEQGGRVVWTLRTHGPAHSVPGKVGVEAYRLHHAPMAMGSFPPALRLREDGPAVIGPMTLAADPRDAGAWTGEPAPGSLEAPVTRTGRVGEPLTLTAWVEDRRSPDAERAPVEGGTTWDTHQGPAPARFADGRLARWDGAPALTTATFDEPGTYLLRVRGDNFNRVDSTPQDQCCWTNAYVEVTVAP